ncbi:polysaccharide deacetylase family protein [Aminipila luticellarii]|uniref:NodB homology domain-containing protein n=1 Tax=Aminipila luticellarii TaxID=2507160 RepID=A0A410PWT9_9FIRM|nr:polysaccharide deacetylase family protein [Aminipila luticellarii]QAT43350.1 hypothetical protein EQM06_09040 [Aminipila luticellarii]
MKERSVAFYKRLIVFTALSAIIVIACLLTFLIGNKLDFWSEEPAAEKNVPAASKTIEHQIVTSAAGEKENPEEPVPDKIAGEVQKTVYLTFDDGSSSNTPQILDILAENHIQATFFFNTSESQTADNIIQEAYDGGHAIGVLTSTDGGYHALYSSVGSYLQDFEQSYGRILRITGEPPTILRFPGGSINGYDKNRYPDLIKAVAHKGMVYFDWNVCADDGSGNMSKEAMIANATKLPEKSEECILLMHDNGNDDTCEALQEIIRFYKEHGYEFKKLTADVKPITF